MRNIITFEGTTFDFTNHMNTDADCSDTLEDLIEGLHSGDADIEEGCRNAIIRRAHAAAHTYAGSLGLVRHSIVGNGLAQEWLAVNGIQTL